MRYEYKVMPLGTMASHEGAGAELALLKEEGLDGWKLVNVVRFNRPESVYNIVYKYYFMRELP